MPRSTTPLTSSSLSRGGGLAPVSRKRAKVNVQRRVVVSAMRVAAAGRCARCHRGDVEVHGHERRGRAQGGSILKPECLLCNECNGWCEDNPVKAAHTGWKVSGKHGHAPELGIGQAYALDGTIVDFGLTEEAA